MDRKIWKNVDGSISLHTGKNKRLKSVASVIAQAHGYNVVDLGDQLSFEPTKKTELILNLNRSLNQIGYEAISSTVEANSLKDYIHDYAEMTDSPELLEYLGKQADQAHRAEKNRKATHDLKDCVEDAERKAAGEGQDCDDTAEAKEISEKELDFVEKKSGKSILKHAIFSKDLMGPQKAARMKEALVKAVRSSGLELSDFAMWASEDEALILADHLYEEVKDLRPQQSGLTQMAYDLFYDSMIQFFKNIDRAVYQHDHELWEEKLGTQEKPQKKKRLFGL